jgi:hypothetical protein
VDGSNHFVVGVLGNKKDTLDSHKYSLNRSCVDELSLGVLH